MFIANPNNPTGTWAAPAAVKRLLERAAPSTLVVLDEAYFEYGRERGTQDGLAWLAEHPNLVILRTFSKAYGLAGARVGYAISHPEIADVLNRLRPAFNVNSLAQAGALAALADQAHMRSGVSLTMRELTRVEAELRRLGLWTAPSAGNFLLVRLGQRPRRSMSVCCACGLIVRPLAGLWPARVPAHLDRPAGPERSAARDTAAGAGRERCASAMSGSAASPAIGARRYLVRPAASVHGELTVPGDKSISHRALMLGGIAEGATAIRGFLASEDCLATLAALRALGVRSSGRPRPRCGCRAWVVMASPAPRGRSTWAMPVPRSACSWGCWPGSASTARSSAMPR